VQRFHQPTVDDITLYQAYYPTITYEREIYLDNKLGHQTRLIL
jgi:hypothetical protein